MFGYRVRNLPIRRDMHTSNLGPSNRALIRDATIEDSTEIARIYNEGIEDRTATFEVNPRSQADIVAMLHSRAGRYPTIAAEVDGKVVAAAWCSEYRARDCYSGIAEFSVYTDRRFRGQGVGALILRKLLAAAEVSGFWKLVSRVFPENVASHRLLAKVGFREVGVYHRHGKLDGVWRDCVIVERLLGLASE